MTGWTEPLRVTLVSCRRKRSTRLSQRRSVCPLPTSGGSRRDSIVTSKTSPRFGRSSRKAFAPSTPGLKGARYQDLISRANPDMPSDSLRVVCSPSPKTTFFPYGERARRILPCHRGWTSSRHPSRRDALGGFAADGRDRDDLRPGIRQVVGIRPSCSTGSCLIRSRS